MSWRTIWRGLTRRRRFERELDDELAFHVESRAAELVRAGVEPVEAVRRARLELGMVETHKAEVRAAHGLAAFDGLALDLRHAWRALVRNPLFAATAVAILGLAIAANAALFAFFDAYVLRAPAVRAPDRLVDVMAGYHDGQVVGQFPLEDAEHLVEAGRGAFEGLYFANIVRAPLLGSTLPGSTLPGSTPTMTYGLAVSAGYFELLGARLQRGRAFGATETRAPVLVLSASGWRHLASANPDVVGTTLTLGPTAYTVVGVAADDFRGVDVVAPQYWIPRAGAAPVAGDLSATTIGGLLKPGVTSTQAQAALQPVFAERAASPDPRGPTSAIVAARTSLFDPVEAATLRSAAIPVFAGFLLVLLVACANLANLALARAAARRRELAIRLAVGASRWRVVRHLMVEAGLIAACAALFGTLACAAAVEGLQRYAFGHLGALGPDLVPAAFELRRFAYVGGLALVAALAIGLAPALEASMRAPGNGVRNIDGDGRARSGRLRDALLVAQLASSAVLLVLASLIVANGRRADELKPGYDIARVVDLSFAQPTERLVREVERVPGVRAVTGVARAPLRGRPDVAPIRVGARDFGIAFTHVDQHYFETLGIALRRGRAFLSSETLATESRAPARVAVVSAATAAGLWPGEDALGRAFEITLDGLPLAVGRYEVVGVADDVVSGLFIEGTDRTMVYFPAAIGSAAIGDLLVRVDADSLRTRRALVDACTRADPAVLCEPESLNEVLANQSVPFTVAGAIASGLGFAALAISCIGLYGVVAFTVARRTREIGVRVALGATPRAVLRFVLGGALRRIALGLAIGLPLCLAVSTLIATQVQFVRAFDARSYLAMPLLLLLVASAAAFVPARRAARIAPVEALREDG